MGFWGQAIAPLRLCWLQDFMKKRLVSIKEYLEDLTCQALEGTHEWLQGLMWEPSWQKKSSQVEKDVNNLCLSDHWKHPRFSLLIFVTSNRQINFHLQTEVMKKQNLT